MAHLHKKMKKGRPYYYIREIQRVNGKPKVISQIYVGSIENIAKLVQQGTDLKRPIKTRTEEFGSLFVAHALEQEIGTIGLVDAIVPRGRKEEGPTVGEYFFYAWANRMIEPKSKRALEQWYKKTAVQQIRPVETHELTSIRYWKKWNKVSERDIETIGRRFFERIWAIQKLPPECILFDTTNTYTYMDSGTPSELCQRGKSKDNKHHLRQVGLGLLVDRETEIPLFYKIYPGNNHDSKFFHNTIDEMFGVLCEFNQTKQKLTVVFDKGMNSDENIGFIDDHTRVHFITTYSPYFVEDIATTDLKYFTLLDTEKNRQLADAGAEEDRQLAYRTTRELWGKERSVIVTYTPRSYRKRMLKLNVKLETVRENLLEFRRKHREHQAHWRDRDAILRRYERLCERLHIGSQYYQIEFGDGRKAPDMTFRKNLYEVEKSARLFGRNIIVTDNRDWTTDEIVQRSTDRERVERAFRTSKDSRHVTLRPFFHWTDSKIRCQLLTCVIALTMSRLLERRVKDAGIKSELGSNSSRSIIEEMRSLNSVLNFYPSQRNAERIIEDPTKLQSEVLRLLGWRVAHGGVLQPLAG